MRSNDNSLWGASWAKLWKCRPIINRVQRELIWYAIQVLSGFLSFFEEIKHSFGSFSLPSVKKISCTVYIWIRPFGKKGSKLCKTWPETLLLWANYVKPLKKHRITIFFWPGAWGWAGGRGEHDHWPGPADRQPLGRRYQRRRHKARSAPGVCALHDAWFKETVHDKRVKDWFFGICFIMLNAELLLSLGYVINQD